MSYTTDDLLNSVKSRAMLPDSTNGLSDARLLAIATEELQLSLLKMIRSVREEFYVTSKSYTITQNQSRYLLPARASGLTLRDVQVVTDNELVSLEPIAREDATSLQTGTPTNYYFEHNNVVLYPTPSATQYTLKLSYFFRPSALVGTASAAKITAIDTNTNVVTVASIPSTWTTGVVLDFISQGSPYANLAIDQTSANISSTDITFATLPEGLAVNDYLALAECSPLPQVPVEFEVILAQMTVCRALMALGQVDLLQAAQAQLKVYIDDAISLLAPRNEGSLKKIVNLSWNSRRF